MAFHADFNCTGCILLVIKNEKRQPPINYNKAFEKNFKEDYSGEFEMVSWEDLDSIAKYQDKEIYRHVLYLTKQHQKTRTETQHTTNGITTKRDVVYTYAVDNEYRIYHRKENKTYPELGHYTMVSKAIKWIAEALEKKLKN
jgi:hypothetical protein